MSRTKAGAGGFDMLLIDGVAVPDLGPAALTAPGVSGGRAYGRFLAFSARRRAVDLTRSPSRAANDRSLRTPASP
jgi:hypothetical protein